MVEKKRFAKITALEKKLGHIRSFEFIANFSVIVASPNTCSPQSIKKKNTSKIPNR